MAISDEMRELLDALTPAFRPYTLPLPNGDYAEIHPITFGRARIGYMHERDLGYGYRDVW